MELQAIEYERSDGWACVTLNRPEKRNALSARLLDELASVLWEADEDRDVRVVLLRGAGPSFCAGYEFGGDRRTDEPHHPDANNLRGIRSLDDDIWHIEQRQRRMLTIFDMHKPVVAQVHGNVVAGGIDLMVLCDMVIAAENARIAFPPGRNMGTLPVNMWLFHTNAQWAKRLLMTGDVLSGRDAARIGLVLDAVPADDLDDECTRLVERLALVDADVLAASKRSVNLAMELMGARTMQRLAAELDGRGHQARSAQQFGRDVQELGMKAANQKRDEPFGDSEIEVRWR